MKRKIGDFDLENHTNWDEGPSLILDTVTMPESFSTSSSSLWQTKWYDSRTKSTDSIIRQLLSDQKFLLETIGCASNVYLSTSTNNSAGVSYLRRLGEKHANGVSFSHLARNELRVLFRHVNSKRNVVASRYKFVLLVLILRLFATLKSCGKRLKSKNCVPVFSQRRRKSAVDRCVGSLVRDFAPVICRMSPVRKRRRKRNAKNERQRRNRTQTYVDNAYQQTLIANFIENSLADLKMPQSVVEKKRVTEATFRPSINVQVTMPGAAQHNDWSLHTTTQIYPVPLKPQPYDRPELVTESLVHWSHVASNSEAYKPTESTHIVTESHWYRPKPPLWYPPPPLPLDDIALHFPYPNKPSTEILKEPVFVEPIVVPSIDHLPTNYPIPMENVSLGHNPFTVVVGSQSPEIVILEDATFSNDTDEPVELTTIAVQEDPAAAGGAAGSAVGPAIAAAAGLGALGAVGAAAGAAGIAGGAVAGASVVAAAGANAAGDGGAGAGAGAGVDAGAGAAADVEVAGTGSVGVALTPTDVTAYVPAEDDEESGLEMAFTDIYGFLAWLLPFGFLRSVTTALYTLILPHISFLLTSGFTVITFLFPWLYPHIVVPLASALSSLPTFRSMEEQR